MDPALIRSTLAAWHHGGSRHNPYSPLFLIVAGWLGLTGPASGQMIFPLKLNDVLATVGDVQPDFQVSSDGSWVVFRADREADQVFDLYSAPIAGGMAVKLNGGLVTGGVCRVFRSARTAAGWRIGQTRRPMRKWSSTACGSRAER
jgi:hypothetical protein